MNGNAAYEYKFQQKIDNLLSENSKLIGFYSFIVDKSISTIYTYLLNVNSFLVYIKNKEIEQLNVDDFSGYMLKIQKNKCGDKTTSSYRITVYSSLKKYGKYLVAAGYLDKNPMDFIDRPKQADSQDTIIKRENGYLSQDEIKQYLSNVSMGTGSKRSIAKQKKWRERDLAITILFLNTGIRCSALMKIDVDDVDFGNKTLTVTDKESYVNKYALSDEVLSTINLWIKRRSAFLNNKTEDALFISNRRTRMDQKSIYRVVCKYAKDIQGKHITPHKLRATYGTQLYNETKDIYFVQQCMHHINPKTTEIYIRGECNKTKEASEIMKKIAIFNIDSN